MKGLYIHIPFCVRKCEYCDFVSFAGKENCIDRYIDALGCELEEYKGTRVDTIFIGGGTPSVLNAEQITRVCAVVRDNFVIDGDVEWSIEVNPGTVEDSKIKAMLIGGINRVSVGVQSFNNKELAAVGRIHNDKTAYDTVMKLSKAGFTNISIDLMESLPYQTAESFAYSLKKAVELPIKHISVYSLIIEEGTPLKEKYDRGIYCEPDEDTDRDMYAYTARFLKQYGFERYEISNYAKAGFESRHNIKYWQCEEYIGAGLAAHSYYRGRRYSNTTDLEKYMSGDFRSGEEEELTENDKMSEFMMLGLRMMRGIDTAEFEKRFGKSFYEVYGKTAARFEKLGLLEYCGDFCRLTEKGIDVSNSVMCEFII